MKTLIRRNTFKRNLRVLESSKKLVNKEETKTKEQLLKEKEISEKSKFIDFLLYFSKV